MTVLQPVLGLAAFVLLARLAGERRGPVPWRVVTAGVALQLVLALLLLRVPRVHGVFAALNRLMLALDEATRAGTSMVFGFLGGAPLPYAETTPGASYVLAFRGLPMILVVSALSSLLFHWNVLPRIVRGFARVLERTLGIGGAEGVGVAANVFVGMVEAPLLVRPYLERMTRAELFSVMASGMATIAGTVMVLYATILGPVVPDALGHILTASIISAPAAVVVARLMVPARESATAGDVTPPHEARGAMDAITQGTLAGVQLVLSVVAMIVVLVALVHLVDIALAQLPRVGGAPLELRRVLGWAMAPVMWLVGIPWDEAARAGALMGTKTVLNEFVAYLDLAHLEPGALSERSRLLVTYALCGFANPGSLGILIGGMGQMAPSRRGEIVALGARSIVAGTLATCMTAAIAALVL